MICRTCQREIDEEAAFCPLCGADLVLGEPWETTLGIAVEDLGPLVPDPEQLEGMGYDELALPMLYRAHALSEAENVLASLCFTSLTDELVSEPPTTKRALRLMAVHFTVVERAAIALWLHVLAFLRAYSETNDLDDLWESHPQVAWAIFTEFGGYYDIQDTEGLRDVIRRRMGIKAARLGGSLQRSWEEEDSSFQISFNGLLLSPFPGDGAAFMPGMENVETGADTRSGELRLSLVPTVWRYWDDEQLALPAMAFVYEQSPYVGMDLHSEAPARRDQLEEIAQEQRAFLAEKWEVEVDCTVETRPGLSLVECRLRNDFERGEIAQRHLWLYLPEHTFFLRCFGYLEAPEYINALEAALDGFVPSELVGADA